MELNDVTMGTKVTLLMRTGDVDEDRGDLVDEDR